MSTESEDLQRRLDESRANNVVTERELSDARARCLLLTLESDRHMQQRDTAIKEMNENASVIMATGERNCALRNQLVEKEKQVADLLQKLEDKEKEIDIYPTLSAEIKLDRDAALQKLEEARGETARLQDILNVAGKPLVTVNKIIADRDSALSRLQQLEAENTDLKETLRKTALNLATTISEREQALEKVNGWREELAHKLHKAGDERDAYRDAAYQLKERVQQLEGDKERLGWLEKNWHIFHEPIECNGFKYWHKVAQVYKYEKTLREAIDAARSVAGDAKEHP